VDKNLESLFYIGPTCHIKNEDKVILKDLDSEKEKFLLDRERERRLKSGAT
jgi:hypothetical protein